MKTHHYIISFDPRDAADNGLTMETAQALGLKFCEENFPGHPAIVCTHPDGHNHSGNIHVHIVIGSIRTREVERKPYMQKPRDWREGMKHSSTAQTMRHLRVEVMELCEGAGLYQIDLLNGSKERVSEAEYWARRRGQLKLDRENAALTAAGQQPRQKKFETVKDTLRKQISSVLYRAVSLEDFSDRLMQQYGIAVKESRGQLSYLPSGRTKFIRAKHLGDKFDKAAVLATLQANAERKPMAQFKQDTIGKLIDIQSRMTEGKGIGYKRWLTKHNLKVMAQTVKLLQEKGLTDEDALNQRITELETKYHDSLAVVKDLEGRMKANKELQRLMIAGAGCKLAFSIATNMTVLCMLYGAMMGNYDGLYLPMMIVGYIFSVPFFLLTVRTSQKHGQKASLVRYTGIALAMYVGVLVLLVLWKQGNPAWNLSLGPVNLYTVLFIIFFGIGYGAYYSTADMPIPMVADCSDYETFRSGRYIPGIMGTLFSLVDKLVSSLGSTVVGVAVAMIGIQTLPDGNTPYSDGMHGVVIVLFCIVPMLAWIITLIAMKGYTLTGKRMKEIQAVNAVRKDAISQGMTLEDAMKKWTQIEQVPEKFKQS
mgnify:CR=1 FL=1